MKTPTLKQMAFIPLAIVIVWGFSFGITNAQTFFQPPFWWFHTSIAGSNTISLQQNTDSYDVTCSATGGACVVGIPFSTLPDTFMRNSRQIIVDYQVLSVSTPTKCEIGIISATRNIANATSVSTTTSRTTATLTHTLASAVNNFGFGIRSNDTSNPCVMTLRVYSVKNILGEILWSPVVNGISSSGGGSVDIDTTEIENRIDAINSTLVLFFLFALSFLGYMTIINMRKN